MTCTFLLPLRNGPSDGTGIQGPDRGRSRGFRLAFHSAPGASGLPAASTRGATPREPPRLTCPSQSFHYVNTQPPTVTLFAPQSGGERTDHHRLQIFLIISSAGER